MTSNECEKESKKALEDFYNYIRPDLEKSMPQCTVNSIKILIENTPLEDIMLGISKHKNEEISISLDFKGIVSCSSQNARFEFTEDKKLYIYPNSSKGTKITLLK